MNVDPGLQLDLLGALQRRLGMIVSIVGGSLLLAYWVAMALPNYYQSQATIFVEPQSINKRLVESGASTTDLGYRLSLMTAQILSRPRLSRVIDELGLYEDESEVMLREEVIALMRSRINIIPVQNEMAQSTARNAPSLNTFIVTFVHKKPRLAADVAQRLANDFVKEHIEERVGQTRTSLEFIETELQRLSQTFQTIEERVAKVKTENAGRLPEDILSNQRIMDRTMSDLRSAHRVLDQARSEKAFWDTQILSATALSTPNDDASPLRRLQLLELQISELRSRGFTAKHPDLIRAENEVIEVRRQIEAISNTEDENPLPTVAQQNAEAQRERAALDAEMATKEVERLQAGIDLVELRLAATPQVAEKLNALDQRKGQLRESLKHFADRQLRAKVQVDVERRQLGEQFRILEAAFPAPTPSSPNRFLIIVMGLVIGVALGFGGAVLAEATDTSFRVIRDVQSITSIPVLAAIPDIIMESDRTTQRRRMIRNVVAASIVVVFCLSGGAATYMYVNGTPGWLTSVLEGEEELEEGTEAEEASLLMPDGRLG